jgi:DNA-binding CsgD family transcriptional regulator
VRARRLADAEPLLSRFAEQAEASRVSWALARVAHLRGLLAPDTAFAQYFEEATRLHAQARQPFTRARTALAYGERLRRARRRGEARAHLRAALRTFQSLGALPWAERAAHELRASGERVALPRQRSEAQLTPQELQVARIVANGATNREAAAELFLSTKTIEKHLGSVYAKLGVRSRAELARLLSPAHEPALSGANRSGRLARGVAPDQ